MMWYDVIQCNALKLVALCDNANEILLETETMSCEYTDPVCYHCHILLRYEYPLVHREPGLDSTPR